MALTRATRYILSERVTGAERRDYERIGFNFRLTSAISSTKEALDPEWSVKALNSTAGDEESDSAKRSSGGLKETIPEIRFAPNKKRSPGDVLKLHVTSKDMMSGGSEPNFGWIPGPRKRTEAERAASMREAIDWKKRQPKIVVHDYDIDPRTGERIETSKQSVQVKALGRSLGSLVPGGNLGSRAARALSIVVDDLGKFRCPPGTPAANQFTDEFGTNCFQPPVSARRALGRLRHWFNDHVAMGRYLMTLEATEDDPEFAPNRRAMAEAANMRASDAVFNAKLAEQAAAIETLQNMLGTSTETSRNEDMWSLLEALSNNGMWDSSWQELFTDAAGKRLWDPSKSMKENLDAMDVALRKSYADTLPDGLTPEEVDEMTEMLAQRHMEVMRGFMTGVLHEFHDDPDGARLVKNLSFRDFDPSIDKAGLEQYWQTEAMLMPETKNPSDGFAFTLHFNPTAVVLRPMLDESAVQNPPGKIRIVSTDGVGLEGQQWRAIESFMKNTMDLERWRSLYANEMSAARHGGSIQQQARHIAYHEMGHLQQYKFISERVIDQYNQHGGVILGGQIITDPPSTWDNNTWANLVEQTLQRKLPDEFLPDGFPPVGITAFEGSMLHILSGRYYQDLVDEFWSAGIYGPQGQKRQAKLALMLMEGMTELRALQKMGVVDSEIIDQQLEWMNGRSDLNPPTPSTGGTPRGGPRPPRTGPPSTGGPTVDPPDNYPPTNGPDAPPGTSPPDDTELSVIPSGITWLKDPETDAFEAAQGPWDLMERYLIARFGGRPDDKTGGNQEVPRKSIARTWGWPDVSYAQLSADDLDTRFETLRNDLDDLLDRRDAGEDLSDDDLARMWLAAKGMQQIADENKRRRNANAAERQRRSSKFERNDSGRYFRPSGRPYTKNRLESDETYDEDRARAAMKDLENSIPQRFPDAGRSWTRDPEKFGAEQEMTARRKMTRREQDAMTKDMKERNTRYVHGGVELEEAIKRAAKLKEQRRSRDSSDAANTDAPDPSPAVEIEETIIPLMDAVGRSTVSETVEGYLVDGTDVDGRGFTTIQLVSSDQDSDIEYSGQARTKVVVPKGMNGLFHTDRDSGDTDRLLLPPGEFDVVDDGSTGVRTLVPRTQMSTSDWANARLGDLEGMGRPMSVAEMRERDRLRTVLSSRAEAEPRVQTSPYSRDSATRVRMARRRNEYDRGFVQEGVEPFNPDAASRDPGNDVNAIDELRNTVIGMNYRGDTGPRLPENFFVDALTEETRDFLERSNSDEVVNQLTSAAMNWRDGIDRRPILRMGDRDIESLERGVVPRNNSPARREMEADLGWPTDAALESRPTYGHLKHEVHDNIVDDLIEAADRAGFPAVRRAEFFDHSGESPRGPLGFLGQYDVVLRAEASFRTGFGLGDVLRDPAVLMRFNENSALTFGANISISRRGREASAQRVGNFLHAGITGDFRGIQMRRQPELADRGGIQMRAAAEFRSADMAIEAAVAGGFQLDEIERIDVPVSTLPWRESGLLLPSDIDLEDGPAAQFLINAGWTQEERQFLIQGLIEGRFVDVKGANLLRQHRAAAQRKLQFDRAGLNARFTNSEGIDLFSRADITSATDSGARIGRVRNIEEALSIRLQDEIMARQSTLQPIVQQGMRSFRERVTSILGERVADAASERIGEVGRRISAGSGRPTGRAALTQRLLNSERATNLLRRAGLEDDNIEMIQMVGEMAVGFSSGGPAGVGLVIARRAGREGIDVAVRKAVEQGWLDSDQARKILSAADRVAPEGLPDAVTDALSDATDRVVDSDAAAKAREIADAVATRVGEFGLIERLDDVKDRITDRIRGRDDTPQIAAAPTAYDPFGFESGLRSRRQSIVSQIPELDLTDGNFEKLKAFSLGSVGMPDSVDQRFLEEGLSIVGPDVMITRYDGTSVSLREAMTQQSYGDDREYLSISQFGISKDDIIAAIDASELSDDDKRAAREAFEIADGLSQISRVRASLVKPPPGLFDDEEEWSMPTAEEVSGRIDEILSRMPERFGSDVAEEQQRVRSEREIQERRDRVTSEVNSRLNSFLTRIGMFRRREEADEIDRTAPQGAALAARPANPDYQPAEPNRDVLRTMSDLEALARDSMVVADSLIKPEHREELRSLLLTNPDVVAALADIRERAARGYIGMEDYEQAATKEGVAYAGRELVDAIIRARGFDAPAARLTPDEVDFMQYVGGFVPISRGGNTDMARLHVTGEGFPIGEGVDGAGVYMAVEGAAEEAGVKEHFEAAIYAGQSGSVMRGVVSPSAKFTSPTTVARQWEQYRQEANLGSVQEITPESNPILDLRRQLVAAGETDLVEALDLAVGPSSSDHQTMMNGYAVMALLQGYDGLQNYGGLTLDNRVILYNRSAVMVSTDLLSSAEYTETKPWDRLRERAEALASIHDVPIGLSAEERTQWILRETERELEKLS